MSFNELAKKLASSNEESMISKNLKETLSKIQDRLSLNKSASSADKMSTLTNKLVTSPIEKTPMLARTKISFVKKPKKFKFKLRNKPSVTSGSSMSSLEESVSFPSKNVVNSVRVCLRSFRVFLQVGRQILPLFG